MTDQPEHVQAVHVDDDQTPDVTTPAAAATDGLAEARRRFGARALSAEDLDRAHRRDTTPMSGSRGAAEASRRFGDRANTTRNEGTDQ